MIGVRTLAGSFDHLALDGSKKTLCGRQFMAGLDETWSLNGKIPDRLCQHCSEARQRRLRKHALHGTGA